MRYRHFHERGVRHEKESRCSKADPKANPYPNRKICRFFHGAGIIQTVTFTLLNEVAHFAYWGSYLTALVLSVLYNFTVNRRYTFKSATNVPIAMLKIAIYYCIFTPISTYLGNMAASAEINEYLVLIVTMLCNMSTEFLVCRFWVYRNSINTNKLAQNPDETGEAKNAKQPEDAVK